MKQLSQAKRNKKKTSSRKSAPAAPSTQGWIVSYSQNYEDVLLHRLFSGVEDGFYVDIGAYDPVIGSVTKIFYDRGWNGINIEPASVFERLAAARPRDINLKLAVLDRRGEVDFVEDGVDRGMSHVKLPSPHTIADGAGSRTFRVPCERLDNILTEHAAGRLIHFMKIDAEGSENRIINSIDWRAVRPQVLVIEAVAPWTNRLISQDWEPTLLANGYRRAYFDGLNLFFVRDEDAHLLEHFNHPVNILDRFERYDPEKIKVREDLHSLWQTNSELVAASDLYAGKIAQLDKDLKALWQANSELVVSRDGFFSANAESLAKLQAVTQANADLVAEREAYLREKASVSEQLASSQQAIATLVGERDEALNEAKGWHGRYDDVELRLDRVAIEHNALAVALDEATADVAHKAGAIAELTGNVRALEETVAALKPLETRLELALSEGNALALARDEALADGKRKAGVITGLQRRLHTLEETVAALELKLERALIESNVLARAYDEAVADAKRKAGVLAGLQERASALEETVAGLKPLESKLEHALSHGNALALARDEARADATRKAGMIVEFEGQVRALQEAIAALKPVAARYDRLANELRAEDAPRSIRLVLPIARALRAGTRMFGRRPKVATPVQAVVPVDQGHAVAVAAPAAPPKQSWTKRFALFLYTRLGRVFIRPLAWRARTFLLAPLRPHLDDSRRAMTEQLDAIGRNLEGVRLTLEPLRPVSGQLDSVSQEFWARLHAVSQDLAALHRALEPLRPTGEKLDAIAANLEAVRVAELAVQHQLASFTGRGHELSPEFIKSIEALLLTIAVRSPRD